MFVVIVVWLRSEKLKQMRGVMDQERKPVCQFMSEHVRAC